MTSVVHLEEETSQPVTRRYRVTHSLPVPSAASPIFPKAICAEHPLWCTHFISEEISVIILKILRLRTGREESGPYQCHAGPSEGLLSPNSSFLLPSPPHSILLSSTLSLPCFRGYNSSFLIKSQGNLQNHCNSFKNTKGIFHKTRANDFKICVEAQRTLRNQGSLEKEQNWRRHCPWFWTMLQRYRNQSSMVLAEKQTHRSVEQTREPRNKPTHLWSINL